MSYEIMKEENEKANKIRKIKSRRRNIRIIVISVIALGIIGVAIFGGVKNNSNIKGDGNDKTTEIRKDDEDKQKKKAINVAIKKFEELGEKVNKDNLEVLKIERKGEFYYYISSKENTVEVRISDNKITRVNSVVVDK